MVFDAPPTKYGWAARAGDGVGAGVEHVAEHVTTESEVVASRIVLSDQDVSDLNEDCREFR